MLKQTDLFCEWLSNYIDYEYTTNTEGFSLDTMLFLVKRLGMPQDSFKSVHVFEEESVMLIKQLFQGKDYRTAGFLPGGNLRPGCGFSYTQG